jgi:hypothetical protein
MPRVSVERDERERMRFARADIPTRSRNKIPSIASQRVRNVRYRELGASYFDRLRHSQSVERLTRRLEQLGYEVHLEPRPAAV